MRTYNIKIEEVSPGTQSGGTDLKPGTGQYAQTPTGPVEVTVPLTQAQVVGIQGYLSCIAAGANTSSVETAITAVGPT